MEEEFSFEDVYRQVTWDFCVDAALKAVPDLLFLVYERSNEPQKARQIPTLQGAAVELIAAGSGGLRIHGSWMVGGKSGKLDVIDITFSPTATETYIVRFVQESVRLQIAKTLHSMATSPTDLPDEVE